MCEKYFLLGRGFLSLSIIWCTGSASDKSKEQSEKIVLLDTDLEKEVSLWEVLYMLASLFSDNDTNIVEMAMIKNRRFIFRRT